MKVFEAKLVLVTVLTALLLGVFIHDTKVDKALSAYIAPVVLGVAMVVDLSMLLNRAHTHSEAGDVSASHNAQLNKVRRKRRLRSAMPEDTLLFVPGH